MPKYIISTIFFLVACKFSFGQLQSGPMPGYSEMRETAIWVQTKGSHEVFIKYSSNGHFKNQTNTVLTGKEKAFCATLIADKVEPGKTYSYQLFIDGKHFPINRKLQFKTPPLWQFRTDPPNMKFIAGSCTYINDKKYDRKGRSYGGGYEIFETMAQQKADFMLWLGDNTYYRELDWNTFTGMAYRNSHTRSNPDMQNLLSSTNHLAIWDDHDYGPNDSDRSFWNKKMAKEVFDLFWANPKHKIEGCNGITNYFTWGDIDFFMLDNRYDRSPNQRKSGERTILGKIQKEWLKDVLASSKASFKIVIMGGQFLNDAAKYEMYSNYGFHEERQEIIDFIQNENIRNVVFLNGDRHHSEFSVLKKENFPTIYDLTVSPLTSGTHAGAPREKNTLRVPKSLISNRNFALIEVSGKRKHRKMSIKIMDQKGKINFKANIN
tara:strand:+ start:10591 stop:11895 length:1305 start_codon:yes stop_codon:yes gene_type:complete